MSPQATRTHDAAEVGAALERVFARPELAPDEQGFLERGLEWLFDALPSVDPDPELVGAFLWVVAILGALAFAWLLRRSLVAAARSRPALPGESDARAPAIDVEARLAELRARADAARRSGDLSLALRLSFFALLVALSRRGDLELRESWTHREMLARGRTSERARAALEPWLAELDAKLFGARGVTPADLEWFDALSERTLAGAQGGVP